MKTDTTTTRSPVGYTAESARAWLSRWPWLHQLARPAPAPGMPPPPRSDHWHLEHVLAVRLDLARAADTLPEPTRTVTILHHREDWSYQEIASGRGPAGQRHPSGFAGMVDASTIGSFARLGQDRMIAALCCLPAPTVRASRRARHASTHRS